MHESLQALTTRVNSFELNSVPSETPFFVSDSAREKFQAATGEPRPFYGSTIIYDLNEETKLWIDGLATRLHDELGEALTQPLPRESFHLTLHDLRAHPQLSAISDTLFWDSRQVPTLLEQARSVGPISMTVNAVFNLMNTSAVIGLVPTTDEDCERALTARATFDSCIPSGAFTPHITLAYYRPDSPRPIDPSHYRALLKELTGDYAGRIITCEPERLAYTYFSDMCTYWSVN
ncbi:hypothetical protein [Schaalia canis]|uniref:2'-5' RNA ligase family protein n=1 Tax=Schaalia canis TaxID=100469 RepID=A0A3P1SFT2_9ACTO|nr:hypothetical protein [Schaalia canis]RRC96018.1 hypothetical protein EII11_04030 [Schaalia canis]